MKRLLIFLFVFIVAMQLRAQEFIPLWPKDKKPNFNGTIITDTIYNERMWRVSTPGIYAFKVNREENKGRAILICPGGSYERLSYLYNGFNLAKWYNTLGINAFVLIYRLPHQKDLVQRDIASLQDAQRAMKIIRSNATAWGIQPDKIGVMGTSAGGHVASTLGIHEEDVSKIADEFDTVPFRPDFMFLLSPVITMGKYAHQPSKKNLLGIDPDAAAIERNSNELHVTASTPPTFMIHALNDSTVNVQNSLLFYSALLEKKINASIHIFPQGGHNIKLTDNPGSTALWMNLLELWLNEKGFVSPITKKIK